VISDFKKEKPYLHDGTSGTYSSWQQALMLHSCSINNMPCIIDVVLCIISGKDGWSIHIHQRELNSHVGHVLAMAPCCASRNLSLTKELC